MLYSRQILTSKDTLEQLALLNFHLPSRTSLFPASLKLVLGLDRDVEMILAVGKDRCMTLL